MRPGAIMAGDTAVGAAPATRAAMTASRESWRLIGAASALGLFLLSHPYWGIVHDAELYVGRAVADADPGGLGRDIFFAHEGQSAFSIYPRLSGAFLGAVGPSLGALLLTLVGLCAWLAALAAFAGRLAHGRLLWACVVTASVVPSYYGQVFRYAEQFATPRLPAEAAVLAGLTALAVGHRWSALAAIALGATIHPIMAAPALGVWALVSAERDRRWLLLPFGAAMALAAAGLAGLPVAERLFRLMDPAWADALSVNAYLFPTQWPGSTWAEAAIRAATILLAIPFVPARARPVLGAVVAVAALGLALTLLAADQWLVVLVVQAQPWRALWLVGVAGALTLPIAAIGLWRSGPGGRIVLACLALGWLIAPLSIAGAAGAGAALLAAALGRRRPQAFSDQTATVAWIAVAAFGAVILVQRATVAIPVVASTPADASVLGHVWLFWILTIPIVLGATMFAAHRPAHLHPALAGAGAVALLGLTAALWDDRPPLTRLMDRHLPDPELARLLPAEQGEILWLKNGVGFAWRLGGRPNWASYTQGASIVFSPGLGAIWRDRMDRLVAAGLADETDRRPSSGRPGRVLAPSRPDIETFCRAPDAPAAIVVPLDGSVRLPHDLATTTYRLPARSLDLQAGPTGLGWRPNERAAILACSAGRQSGALRGTLPG
jgi:hypothetical protein